MYRRKQNVLPGFGLTMGITVTFLSLLILIPLASILAYSFRMTGDEFWRLMTRANVVQAFTTSILCSLSAAVINSVFGFILAWTLVKYDFPGKRLIDGMIELPFALHTAVAGITLSKMYSDQGFFGKLLGTLGLRISYTKAGLTIALIFVGIPFVVRTIQPVLEKLSPVIAGLSYIMTFGRMGWAAPMIDRLNELLGTDISLVFSIPGVVLATIFVTFPFVSRELIPVMQIQGSSEEEAAAMLGAGGFTIFRRIILPHIKWALLYGMILCAARAFGEFGAVYAVSKARGKTFTLPLEIDALYMAGNADSITQAFAVSSLLVLLALLMLILKNIVEYKAKKLIKTDWRICHVCRSTEYCEKIW